MENTQRKKVNFRKVILIAIVIFISDAYFLGQGIVAAITIFVSGFICMPVSVYKCLRHTEDGQYIKKHLIYLLAASMVFVANYSNNKLAIYRSQELVKNLESYKKENGAYPEKLEQLVPKYYRSVPTAKISAMGSFFYHSTADGNPMLFYVIYPPFYRNGYDFQSKEWKAFD